MEKDDIIKLAKLVNEGKASFEEKLRLLKALKWEMEKLSETLDDVKK